MTATLLESVLAAACPSVGPTAALKLAAAGGAPDPDVAALVDELGITEVLHFSTNVGFIGVIACNAVMSRTRLPEEKLLERVYQPNSPVRKDPPWEPFVNLSLTRVNDWMFSTSSRRRSGEDIFWTVLSFDPAILAHPGVVFATTNNIYPRVRRATGAPGLGALFAPVVFGRYDSKHTRTGLDSNQPTDRQAEVLYPGAVPLDFLQTVYVQTLEHRDDILGVYAGFILEDEPPVVVAPEVFN